MSTRLILNTKGKNQIVEEPPGTFKLGKLRVSFENGNPYIALSGDIISPTFSGIVPDHTIVERVTYVGSFAEGLRAEGLYDKDACTAFVETRTMPLPHQVINISGPTIREVKAMYFLVRGGLEPMTNWHLAYNELNAAAEKQDH